MWFIITISGDGEENTVLTTKYRDVATIAAASLPGNHRVYFVPDNWNENDSLTLYNNKAVEKSA